MVNVHELFPKLNEIYTDKGVENIERVAVIIEKMCKDLSKEELEIFLTIMDGGNYGEVYDIMWYLLKQKNSIKM